MANVPCATHTCALQHWCGYAMSVVLETIRINALSVVEKYVIFPFTPHRRFPPTPSPCRHSQFASRGSGAGGGGCFFFFFSWGLTTKGKKTREYQTLFTALNVHGWKRIEMDVRRLLIWGVRERICSIKRRLFGIISPSFPPFTYHSSTPRPSEGGDMLSTPRSNAIKAFDKISIIGSRMM